MDPTPVFEDYWRFAAERQAIYFRRLAEPVGPWTQDPILAVYRFTNAYRASDRVSQYLIREVQYRPDRPQTPPELFFRTLLFKLFNRIQTWEVIERTLGPLVWEGLDLNKLVRVLDEHKAQGGQVYSAAYIMPPPQLGHSSKHANHLALLARMMNERMPESVLRARSLGAVFELLVRYPGIGKFLGVQYAFDLNYSDLLSFSESDFVIAGPGAVDGIAKCFADTGGRSPEAVILQVTDEQERAFATRGLTFQNLYGRSLQPIDCQNLFCEISKYARVAHPHRLGPSGRHRIKQTFRIDSRPLPFPMYPPKWGLRAESQSAAMLKPLHSPAMETQF